MGIGYFGCLYDLFVTGIFLSQLNIISDGIIEKDRLLGDDAHQAADRMQGIIFDIYPVNQYFTAGRVVANSNLLTVLPAYFIESTGYRDQLVCRPLPFALPSLHLEMLWHIRNDRSSANQWLRARLVDAANG